jgi:hypothetical protein
VGRAGERGDDGYQQDEAERAGGVCIRGVRAAAVLRNAAATILSRTIDAFRLSPAETVKPAGARSPGYRGRTVEKIACGATRWESLFIAQWGF